MFEVLEGLPPYGELPKVIGGGPSPVYREGYVVRFLGGTPSEWVGNFQRGLSSFDHVAMHPDGERVLVIAGGNAYVVAPSSQSILETFSGFITSCHPLPEGRGFLFADATNIELFGDAGREWTSRRLAWDGLQVLRIDADEAHGLARHFDDSWHPFRVRLKDGAAHGGAYA